MINSIILRAEHPVVLKILNGTNKDHKVPSLDSLSLLVVTFNMMPHLNTHVNFGLVIVILNESKLVNDCKHCIVVNIGRLLLLAL